MSAQPFIAENFDDDNGKPAGGYVEGTGLAIEWQNGPLGRVGSLDRIEPNGAFVETVLEAVQQRIEYYQTRFPCRENALAVTKIEEALHWLNARTNRRTSQGVEGTHEGR
jgi:hypothetical protein